MESMTGFGQGVYQGDSFQVVCYAKSLNHRYLEVSLKLPKRYAQLEERLRREISLRFSRGKIEVQLKYYGFSSGLKEIFLDLELAKKLKTALEILQAELNFEESLTFQDFLFFRDYLTLAEREEDVEALWEEVKEAFYQALNSLQESRLREGAQLKEKIQQYLALLTNTIEEISSRQKRVTEERIEKTKERIAQYLLRLSGEGLDETRIYQEISLLLERIDFSEELDRLKVHLLHFREVMEEPSCGKKLDFLLQELHREVNTLATKAQNAEISLLVVQAKDLIEKIREQVQNLV